MKWKNFNFSELCVLLSWLHVFKFKSMVTSWILVKFPNITEHKVQGSNAQSQITKHKLQDSMSPSVLLNAGNINRSQKKSSCNTRVMETSLQQY